MIARRLTTSADAHNMVALITISIPAQIHTSSGGTDHSWSVPSTAHSVLFSSKQLAGADNTSITLEMSTVMARASVTRRAEPQRPASRRRATGWDACCRRGDGAVQLHRRDGEAVRLAERPREDEDESEVRHEDEERKYQADVIRNEHVVRPDGDGRHELLRHCDLQPRPALDRSHGDGDEEASPQRSIAEERPKDERTIWSGFLGPIDQWGRNIVDVVQHAVHEEWNRRDEVDSGSNPQPHAK